MNAEQYRAVIGWFNARPAAKKALRLVSRSAVALVYLLYLGMLAWLAWHRMGQLWPALVVPASAFVVGTLVRKLIDRPRPYTALGFTPLFPKDKTGQSMPSRHCFSAAAIVAAAFTVWVPLGVAACLLITADKGLAGAYNQNAIRQAQQFLAANEGAELYVVGEYGRRWFSQRGIPIERSFLYTAQNPTLQRARQISELLLERYDAGEINAVHVIYTDMKNGLEATVRQAQLLPLHRERFSTAKADTAGGSTFEFVPNAAAVLDNAVRSCLTGFIYSALVDSFCSEQSARMTAMNAADQNAEELLKDLSVQYNRARQAAITQEITEVSAGERAQRSKKEKEG